MNSSNVKTVKLKDVLSFVVDNRGKTPPVESSGYRLLEVNAVSVSTKRPLYQNVRKYVGQKIYDTWFRSGHPEVGDILIPTVGTLGAVSLMDTDDCCIAQNLIAIRTNQDICDSNYLYYYLNNPLTRKQLLNLDIGGVQPSIKVPHLMNLKICLPSLKKQKKISNILGSLDAKIELNQKINDNLEQQAQAIFNHFLLAPDNIPDGWREGSLIDIAEFTNGLAMQKYRPQNDETGLPVIKIKELRQGYCDANGDVCSPRINPDYIIRNGDVIFSWSGSLLVDFWCGGTCGLNQHLFKVTSQRFDKWFYYSWVVYHLKRFITIAADKATTMGHIKRGELARAKVLIPSKTDYETIGTLLTPIYDTIISNRIENWKLSELRDNLLPRIMSGEIDV